MALDKVTKVDRGGISTTSNYSMGAIDVGSNIQIGNAGIVTATKFIGDGSDLTSLPAGLGTAISPTINTPLNNIYYVNNILHITEHSTVDVPGTASKAYTQYAEIQVEDNVNLTVGGDCTFIPDVLNFFETP